MRWAEANVFALVVLNRLKSPVMDAIMQVLAPVLEWMFFIGMAGSALVVLISAVEDVFTILERD
jgi:hypothetical protein